MENFTPKSIIKIRKIVFPILVTLFVYIFINIVGYTSGSVFRKIIGTLLVSYIPTYLAYLVLYNYLVLKFGKQIKSEIKKEFRKESDIIFLKEFGEEKFAKMKFEEYRPSDDDSECKLSETSEELYFDLISNKDRLLNKY